MKNQERMLLIPASVAQAVGDYLAGRPWREVSEVMPILQYLQLAPVVNHPESEAEDTSAPEILPTPPHSDAKIMNCSDVVGAEISDADGKHIHANIRIEASGDGNVTGMVIK